MLEMYKRLWLLYMYMTVKSSFLIRYIHIRLLTHFCYQKICSDVDIATIKFMYTFTIKQISISQIRKKPNLVDYQFLRHIFSRLRPNVALLNVVSPITSLIWND